MLIRCITCQASVRISRMELDDGVASCMSCQDEFSLEPLKQVLGLDNVAGTPGREDERSKPSPGSPDERDEIRPPIPEPQAEESELDDSKLLIRCITCQAQLPICGTNDAPESSRPANCPVPRIDARDNEQRKRAPRTGPYVSTEESDERQRSTSTRSPTTVSCELATSLTVDVVPSTVSTIACATTMRGNSFTSR